MACHRNPLPSQQYLKECFEIDVERGHLFWRRRPASHFKDNPVRSAINRAKIWNGRFAGKPVNPIGTDRGYVNVAINGVDYRAHRVIWKMVYGYDPVGTDHLDGNRANNALANLREADQSINAKNNRMRSDNNSGKTGVHFDKSRKKWLASVNIGGRAKHLGRFTTFDQAASARDLAASQNGYTSRHGLPEVRL